jgi:hypothetical protein
MRTAIRDDRYRILGYVETDGAGRQRALNARFGVVGYFEPIRDETRDSAHRIVARGNALAALIWGKL